MVESIVNAHQLRAWSTAGVLDSSKAKLFVGRLVEYGIEHELSKDNGRVKITVQREDLNDALSLRPDREPSTVQPRLGKVGWTYRTHARLLLWIPIGGLLGAIAQNWMEYECNIVTVSACIGITIACESAVSLWNWRKRPGWSTTWRSFESDGR